MNKILKVIKKNSPTILSILACAGVVSTTVLAIKAVPKARHRQWAALEKKEKEYDTVYFDNEPVKFNTTQLTKKEAILASIPAYIPTAVSAAATMACILGANTLNKKAQASLMSAYMLANQHFNEYRKAAKEVYGEDADRKIKERIAIRDFNEDFMVTPLLSYTKDDDESNRALFYEPYTETYFWSTVERVQRAEYHANRTLQLEGGLSLGRFFEFLGVTVEDDVLYNTGWLMDTLLCDMGLQWLDFYNVMCDPDGKKDANDQDVPPYYAIEYIIDPVLDYENWDETPFLK